MVGKEKRKKKGQKKTPSFKVLQGSGKFSIPWTPESLPTVASTSTVSPRPCGTCSVARILSPVPQRRYKPARGLVINDGVERALRQRHARRPRDLYAAYSAAAGACISEEAARWSRSAGRLCLRLTIIANHSSLDSDDVWRGRRYSANTRIGCRLTQAMLSCCAPKFILVREQTEDFVQSNFHIWKPLSEAGG